MLRVWFISMLVTTLGWAQSPQFDGCDEKLSQELERLLKADKQGILALQFHVTVLKTTRKIMSEYGSVKSQGKITKWPAFDSYLHNEVNRLKKLNDADPSLLQSVEKLYLEAGADSITELANHVDALKSHATPNGSAQTRYSNKDVASYMLYERMTLSSNSAFSNQDLAIVWVMKKMKDKISGQSQYSSTKNLLDIGVQVNRYLGWAGDTQAATPEQVASELHQSKEKLRKAMTQMEDELRLSMAECFSQEGLYKGACALNLNKRIADFLLDSQPIIDEVNKKTLRLVMSSAKATEQIELPTEEPVQPLSAPSRQPLVGAGQQCGENFRSEEKNYFRFNLANGTAKKFKDGLAAIAGKLPKSAPCRIIKPELGMEYERKDRSLCCDGKVLWKTDHSLAGGGIEGGFQCDIPLVGLGPVASAGAFVGLKIDAYIEGSFPANCKSRDRCLAAAVRAEPEGGIFGQAAANMVRVEGGVRASPKIQGEQCFVQGKAEPFKLQYQWGSVYLFWKAGFIGFDTQGLYKVYQNDNWHVIFQHQLFGAH